MRNCRAWQRRRGWKVARSAERWRVSAGTSPSLRSVTHTLIHSQKHKQPQGWTIRPCFGPQLVAHLFALFPTPPPSLWPLISLLISPSSSLSSHPGPSWPAETCHGWSPGEHEAGPWCCSDWKPQQRGCRSEKSALPVTTRPGRQTHPECQRSHGIASQGERTWPS